MKQMVNESGQAAPAAAESELRDAALERIRQGFAPPREIYGVKHRRQVDWGQFPLWARPIDPEMFDGCGHEG